MIDATLKVNMPPLALPRENLWFEQGYLGRATIATFNSPWYGYELGDWSNEWADYAKRAVEGDWGTNGSMTETNQKGGMKPETPVRDFEK